MPTDAFVEALTEIPAKHRAWLEADDFELWCYYGWGVVVNSAQIEMANDVFKVWPPGTIHVERWGNRAGKTSGALLVHLYALWRKWRYSNARYDEWLSYLYKTLHSAPLNRLMGKAWNIADALISGRAEQQRDPIKQLQRPGILRPFFTAGKGASPDGSDELFVRCQNGSKLDFLSTHDGAGRLEGESWWLVSWDEFPRQQPVSDVPLLLDQTFLPRTSDFMAPLILLGTAIEDSEPVYGEIEDMAEENPRDWNFKTYGREVNFAMSRESTERQLRLSSDKEAAGRSVHGLSGQGGYGLFPPFTLDNAFVEYLPERTPSSQLPEGYVTMASFDHALSGDENVLTILGVPWPAGAVNLIERPFIGVAEATLRSSRTLVLEEQLRFVENEAMPYKPKIILVDATSEGGLLVYRAAQRARLPAAPFAATGRAAPGVTNKELSLQSLQRLLSWGLDVEANEDTGWLQLDAVPKPSGPFGALRLPSAWRRTRRQMTTYRRYDEKLTQDRVMTLAMLAWHLVRLYDVAARSKPKPFNVMARRRRAFAIGGSRA